METPYFEGYPFPSVTCEGPTSFGVTEAGEVYRIRVIKYPWAADAYLAFIWRYSKENDEVRHIDLGISRDGENWSYFGTNWYIPEGDSEEELTLYGLIRRGDEIWQYVDEGGAHGGDQGRTYYRYRQRLDGFVSLDGDDKAGQATTRPLIVQGERLIVNVLNTSQGRSTSAVKVAIIDDAGQEIPGFGLNDCDPVPADATQHTVSWRKRTDISRLAGHPIRLRFELRNAKLFAFEVAE
jgi:hypothetical protein